MQNSVEEIASKLLRLSSSFGDVLLHDFMNEASSKLTMTELSDPSVSIDMSLKVNKDMANVSTLERSSHPVARVTAVDDAMGDVLRRR